MIDKPYNTEKITSYLLGSLSNDETEQFDELSITDSDFADVLLAAESDLVDAYVLGELPEDTRRRFESFYLATDRARSSVRFAQAFQLLSEPDSPPTLQSKKSDLTRVTKAPWYATLKLLFDFRPALQWGLALCAVALFIAVILLTLQNRSLRRQMYASETKAVELGKHQELLEKQLAEIKTNETVVKNEEPYVVESKPQSANTHRIPSMLSITLQPPLRGAQDRPSIVLNSDTTILAVRLELEPNDSSSYRVTLLQLNRQLWQSGNLNSQGNADAKNVVVRVPTSLLKPGVFVFRVSGVRANGSNDILGDYALQIR